MIQIKSDRNQCNVQMTVSPNELIQDEIVRVFASVLVSFKQQMESFGASSKDIEKDIELMMMNAKLTYTEIKDQKHNFKTEIEEVLDDKNIKISKDENGEINTNDISSQVDNFLNKKKDNGKTS